MALKEDVLWKLKKYASKKWMDIPMEGWMMWDVWIMWPEWDTMEAHLAMIKKLPDYDPMKLIALIVGPSSEPEEEIEMEAEESVPLMPTTWAEWEAMPA